MISRPDEHLQQVDVEVVVDRALGLLVGAGGLAALSPFLDRDFDLGLKLMPSSKPLG
jgi:hypothetical protein